MARIQSPVGSITTIELSYDEAALFVASCQCLQGPDDSAVAYARKLIAVLVPPKGTNFSYVSNHMFSTMLNQNISCVPLQEINTFCDVEDNGSFFTLNVDRKMLCFIGSITGRTGGAPESSYRGIHERGCMPFWDAVCCTTYYAQIARSISEGFTCNNCDILLSVRRTSPRRRWGV